MLTFNKLFIFDKLVFTNTHTHTHTHTHHNNDAEPILTIKLKKMHCEDFHDVFTSADVSVIKWRKWWALLGKGHTTSQEVIVFERTRNCSLSWTKTETRTHIPIYNFHMFQCLLLLDLPIGLTLLRFSDQNYLWPSHVCLLRCVTKLHCVWIS